MEAAFFFLQSRRSHFRASRSSVNQIMLYYRS
jgi:hypothetical protein